MKTRSKSEEIYNRLCEVIPGGVNSPIRACKNMGQLPLVAERASGDTIYDVDGHAYIDYCGSWGPLIHGHAHPAILEAVQKRMVMGTSFGITTEIEEKLARKVLSLIPSVKKIRFVSSGTEATMSAIRLARGYTGRNFVIKYAGNYHGHADFFLVNAGSEVMRLTPRSSSSGIPDELVHHVICLPYNDINATRHIFDDSALADKIAAVILEPIAANMGVVPAKQEFINVLREETKANGSLLIFDEVLTGFRVGLGGAQKIYQTTPDLTCFGKIIGGGFPAAAFGGRSEIMDQLAPLGHVYQAGTLSGNPVAMEAGYQSLALLEKEGFYEELERKTSLITEPIKECIKKHDLFACVQQVGSIFTLFFGRREVTNMEDAQSLDNEAFARFFRFMFDHGVYIPPSQNEAWFVSAAHEEKNLLKTRDLILEFLKF